jgi:hypothetical protein
MRKGSEGDSLLAASTTDKDPQPGALVKEDGTAFNILQEVRDFFRKVAAINLTSILFCRAYDAYCTVW